MFFEFNKLSFLLFQAVPDTGNNGGGGGGGAPQGGARPGSPAARPGAAPAGRPGAAPSAPRPNQPAGGGNFPAQR